MGKGLDLMLERIRQNPAPTLVGRYMALIQDIGDKREKTERVLALAEAITRALPDDALRLAHEVYQLDAKQLRALDIMADAFVAKGRHAKAAILRLEKEKIERAESNALAKTEYVAGIEPPTPAPTATLPASPPPLQMAVEPGPRGGGESPEMGRFALERNEHDGLPALDIFASSPAPSPDPQPPGPAWQQPLASQVQADTRDQRFLEPQVPRPEEVATFALGAGKPSARDKATEPFPKLEATVAHGPLDGRKTPPEGISPRLLKKLVGHAPGDTILPSTSGAISPSTPPRGYPPEEDIPATVLSLFDEPYVEQTSLGHREKTMVQFPLEREREDLRAPSKGKSSKHKDRDRPRSREKEKDNPSARQRDPEKELANPPRRGESGDPKDRRPDFLVGRKIQFAQEFSHTNLEPPPSARIPPSWETLAGEILRLQKTFPMRSQDQIRDEKLQKLALAPNPKLEALPADLEAFIIGVDQRLSPLTAEQKLEFKWNLLLGLWGAQPNSTCAHVMKVMGLRYVSPGFWGLYLDSLLADGQLRVALHEVRQTLIKNPHLDWARLAMSRLPLIWEGLHVYGLTWHEDQGVQALIEGLSERPRPKLAALLGLPPSPKKAAP